MAERPVAFEGPNLGFVVALTFLWLALGLVMVGPGRGARWQEGREVAEKQQRRDDWKSEFGAAEPLSEASRREWSEVYVRMQRFGPAGDAEPALTAWVANAFRAPSIRGLEVTRAEADAGDGQPALAPRSPTGESALVLTPVRLHVRFDALYEDVSRVLARIESPESAFEIRHIELQRNLSDVRVDLELALWTRAEVDS